MRHLVLGTAGHIDHGKTSLVLALTGTDTDRLPEEKRRGITIDLGFARLPLDDDTDLAIVDVPGHEAFVRNMLAGATGIDLVLLVIAADEGVMPQTREHLAIIELLGIPRGVIALTKCDLVEAEWLGLVQEDVAELLRASPLAGAPVIAVSARTGAGLAELRAALADVAAQAAERPAEDLFRMPIDRVFSVRGTGTVVTGTVWSGALGTGQQVAVEPSGVGARVRGLQQHGTECDSVVAGARAAIALAGIDREQLRRGDTLVGGEGWQPAHILTVQLRVLEDAPPLRPRQRVRVHLGTAEALGRVALIAEAVEPGATAVAQLRLESPIVARGFDHVVLRSYSPVRTIAGGVVLEPQAPKRKRLDAATAHAFERLHRAGRVSATVALGPPVGVALLCLPVLTGLTRGQVHAALAADTGLVLHDGTVMSAAALDDCRERIIAVLDSFHAAHPLHDGPERAAIAKLMPGSLAPLFGAALDALIAEGRALPVGSCVARVDHRPRPDRAQSVLLDELSRLYHASGLHAPDLAELPPHLAGADDLPLLLRYLERRQQLVRLTASRWCDAAALQAAADALFRALPVRTPHTMAAYKEVLGVTRKHLIPILEHFDQIGLTQREGDARILVPVRNLGTTAS
jgi:selenocysteine-specific elongation factor